MLKHLHGDFFLFVSSYFVSSICQTIKPTVLIGSSGVGKTFTKEVVEAMASLNEVSHLSLSLPLCDMYKSSL